jgi:uncharacterized coiled-coil protein SlyX
VGAINDRRRIMEMENFRLALPKDVLSALKARVAQEGKTISKILTVILTEYLKSPITAVKYKGESDTLSRFIEEQCVELATYSTTLKAMYTRYRTWCGENLNPRRGEYLISKKALSAKFREHGFEVKPGTGNVRYIRGVGLRCP